MKHSEKKYILTYDDEGNAYIDGDKVEGDLPSHMAKRREEDLLNANMVAIHQTFCKGCESGYEASCRYREYDKLSTKDEHIVRNIVKRFTSQSTCSSQPFWLKTANTAEALTRWSTAVNDGLTETA